MKHLIVWGLLLIPALALAAHDTADHTFFRKLAEGGIGEVDLGQLAQQKGNSQAVKDFATMMVKDHSAANEQLKSLAASKNVRLPSGPGVANRAAKTKLDLLSGETFDKAYIGNQVKAHKDTVALLKKEISAGHDADAQALAQKLLPTVEEHLQKIDAIADVAGVKH